VDSAAGFGAVASDGVPVGAQGDIEVVSFHALKPVSAGEGGAVFCKDQEVAATIRQLVNFCFDDERQVQSAHGLNAKMSELTAAVALASLDGLGDALTKRRELAAAIQRRVPSDFRLQTGYAAGTWQFFPVAAPDAALRDAILAEAARREIGLRTYYDPLHLMPGFAQFSKADALETTSDLGSRMLSLPLAPDFGADEIDAIVGLVAETALRARPIPSRA
jgi:dTDP-4-amino-4,6-dideoxygalactose transaminase